MNIRKTLVLSTGHITPKTAKIWDKASDKNTAQPIPFGYWMPVYTHFEDCEAEVIAICKFAKKHDCDFICFDADADIINELETYDW
jgi:hypothetical protein